MPVSGQKIHARALPEYFQSIQELDDWRATKGPLYPAGGILPYVPRRLKDTDLAGKGRLLVSHDFKGGYVDNPFSKSYTFNWWSSTSIFNYFAHHRITIPPPEWITASHRQGVPILGTIIFEGGSDEDCLRMVIGKLPGNTTGVGAASNASYTVPVSPYYAELLANIAKERGFDGWLLNIEIDLQGGSSQARGLASWITLFQKAVSKAVGPHGQVLWYDSVTIRGNLSWQERLCSRNLPFFLNSDGLFTNYSWWNHFPALQVDYFYSLDPKHTGRTELPNPPNERKTIQDIYTGVDVWGRGSHGGGGFGVYKAIEHIDPQGLGLSVAFFAPGWTWESEETKPGWNWDRFWDYDKNLWVGPVSGTIEVPPHEYKPTERMCTHGPFRPVSNFFSTLPPPDPLDLAFYTNFSPGIGNKWFVQGEEVFNAVKGWTDIDKQTSVGDLLWPRPKVNSLSGGGAPNVVASSSLNFADAWNGGNSLQLDFTLPGGTSTGIWVPIQSLGLSSRIRYEATVVFKVGLSGKTQSQTKVEPGIRSIPGNNPAKIVSSNTTSYSSGWQKTRFIFEIETPVEGGSIIFSTSIGLIIAVSTTPPSTGTLEFSLLVGQIAVHPYLAEEYKDFKATLFWMTFLSDTATTPSVYNGTLSWEVVISLPELPELEVPDREDPNLPWELQPTQQDWFPKFLYFNVYALEVLDSGGFGTSIWIGTTGYDGETKRFFVYDASLPVIPKGRTRRFTFEVEGVLETGEITRWEGGVNGSASSSVPEEQQVLGRARQRGISLKSVLSPLRKKKSKGDISLGK